MIGDRCGLLSAIGLLSTRIATAREISIRCAPMAATGLNLLLIPAQIVGFLPGRQMGHKSRFHPIDRGNIIFT